MTSANSGAWHIIWVQKNSGMNGAQAIRHAHFGPIAEHQRKVLFIKANTGLRREQYDYHDQAADPCPPGFVAVQRFTIVFFDNYQSVLVNHGNGKDCRWILRNLCNKFNKMLKGFTVFSDPSDPTQIASLKRSRYGQIMGQGSSHKDQLNEKEIQAFREKARKGKGFSIS